MNRLKPLNDLVFKKLFGEQADKELLIGLLNAIVPFRIIDADILEEKLTIERIQDKLGILDIKTICTAETLQAETRHIKVNVEVQLLNRHHMIRRSLFYLAKFYTEGLQAGQNFEHLKKTVAVHLLGFRLLPEEAAFHSSYGLYEHRTKQPLTDVWDIHLIEYPKFLRLTPDLHNPLHRWLLFLKEDTPEPILREVIRMDSLIEKANEKLRLLSADEEVRRWAELREKYELDWLSGMSGARKEGREEGREEGRKEAQWEIARSIMKEGLSVEVIARTTGLNPEQIRQLREESPEEGVRTSGPQPRPRGKDREWEQ